MSVIHLDREQFKKLVIEEKRTVLVDFWAPWCTYCRRLEPTYDKVASETSSRQNDIWFAKVNIDETPGLANEYGIEIIPTLMLFQDGQAVASVVNPGSKAQMEAFLSDNLETASHSQRSKIYDVIIIGGGPAGYTAALYTSRAGLSTLVLEQMSAGGQMSLTTQIDNYPGFEEGISGFTLGEKMQAGAERFGAETALAEVFRVDLTGNISESMTDTASKTDPSAAFMKKSEVSQPAFPAKKVETSEGTFYGRTVILATGAKPRKLGIAREESLIGHGVNYCAACDGMMYKDKTVIVVGGGNSAAADALLLSRLAEKVYIVHRRDTLRATKIYHEPLMTAENVEFLWDSAVRELKTGETGSEKAGHLIAVSVENLKTGEVRDVACDGIFVSIGRQPASELFRGQLDLDAAGYIIAGETTQTNIPGVFAIGDVRTKTLRQVITAAADGAVASHYVEEYLAEKNR